VALAAALKAMMSIGAAIRVARRKRLRRDAAVQNVELFTHLLLFLPKTF
jgi:hypothetical protein